MYRRFSPLQMILSGLFIISLFSFFSGGFDFRGTLLMLPGLILGLTLHEFAHAKMADKLGDPTPENQGRLTLNPFAHMDPVGTICLLFGGFGWGKPVQVNSGYFRNPVRDNMLVSLAGPVMNFIIAFISFLIGAIIIVLQPIFNWGNIELITTIITNSAFLNLSLGVFNLLPFPPLDGSKVFAYILKGKAREFIYKLENYSWLVILLLFITPIPEMLVTPVVNFMSKIMVSFIAIVFSFFIR